MAKVNFTPASRSFNNLRQDQSSDFSVLIEVYKVSGRVIEEGRPLSGVKVTLEGSKLTSTTTDGSGNYTFSDLRAGGSYTITPKARKNFTPSSRSFDNLRQDQSADFSALTEVYKISGRVMDAAQPLAGVKIGLAGSKLTSTTTDGSGYYVFTNLRSGGSYTLTPVRARMKFTPGNRSFDNLAQDVSADFAGLGERESKPDSDSKPDTDSKPVSECTEVDQSRERRNIVAKYEARWQENITGERQRIIADNVRDGEIGEATLGPLEPQISFFGECKGASVTVTYVWKINIFRNGKPARVLNVPKRRSFLCGMLGGWRCQSI
jgi:hypothetical protein